MKRACFWRFLLNNKSLFSFMGVGGPNYNFEIISKKRLFFQFRGIKNKFHHIWPPWNKFWEYLLLAPPGKILPTPMLSLN